MGDWGTGIIMKGAETTWKVGRGRMEVEEEEGGARECGGGGVEGVEAGLACVTPNTS